LDLNDYSIDLVNYTLYLIQVVKIVKKLEK